MKSHQRITAELLERVMMTSRIENGSMMIYNPDDGMITTYYNGMPVKKEPYKVEIQWRPSYASPKTRA